MFQRTAQVLEHVPIAERTFRIRLACPEIAAAIRPGQFVMLRLPNTTDPLLGRPFALYDTILENGNPVALDVVYLVVGKMTGKLQDVQVGEHLEVVWPMIGWGIGLAFQYLDAYGGNKTDLVQKEYERLKNKQKEA